MKKPQNSPKQPANNFQSPPTVKENNLGELVRSRQTPMVLNENLPKQRINSVHSVEVIGAEADPKHVNSPERLIKTNTCTPVK